MEQFLESNVGTIVLGIFGLLVSFFAQKYKAKIKEIKDVVGVTMNALEDDKITQDEMKAIIKEIKDVVGK
jgi:hypothetical protein